MGDLLKPRIAGSKRKNLRADIKRSVPIIKLVIYGMEPPDSSVQSPDFVSLELTVENVEKVSCPTHTVRDREVVRFMQ